MAPRNSGSTSTKAKPKARRKRATRRPAGRAKEERVSRLKRPEGLTLEQWQTQLRRQYGAERDFTLENVGAEPIFSEFRVTNPESKNTYRVAIHGAELGENFCSCPDFATNLLGTCKHIEFALSRLRRKRGAKTAFRDGFRPDYSEIFVHYGAQREVRLRIGQQCPVELVRLLSRYFDDEGVVRSDAVARFDTLLRKAEKIDHELRVGDDAVRLLARQRDDHARLRTLNKVFAAGGRAAAWKSLLKTTLYPYQRDGALFAARAGRCLIGDDMGLGKTVQAIATAEILMQHCAVQRTLIVCPTSLKHQWEREIAKFADRCSLVIEGPREQRRELWRQEAAFKITNYDTLHRDLPDIDRWAPELIILDEAQRIKNWETRTARTVKQLDSPYCMVLTGTPLENRLEELVSLVQFVDQHRLGPTYRFLHDHQVREDETGRVVGYRDLDRIGKTLAPILIRRKKDEVLDQLPERMEKTVFVGMTPQQLDYHEENREIVARIVAKWRRYHYLSEADKQRLMAALQKMRMSCNSTYLLDRETDHGCKADEFMTLLDEIWEDTQAKVVVFSQWLGTHELIQHRLNGRSAQHVFFHGGVESRKRKHLIDRFREDPNCRLFLATDAGGVGLNLQNASTIVNMDMPWNPAVLEQRIGRVHRLGQRRPVRVVNFVAERTIEDGMLQVLDFKKSLFEGVLDGGAKDVFMGGSRLKRFMESVDQATGAIPAQAAPSPPSEAATEPAPPETPPAATPSPPEDPLATLMQQGLALFKQIAESSASDDTQAGPAMRVTRDPETDTQYLQLRMPEPEVLNQAVQAVSTLLESIRR